MKIRSFVLVLLVSLLACESQHDLKPISSSGYLHLKSRADYESLAAKATSLSDEELAAFERNNGYVSYRSAFAAVNKSLNAAKTPEEFDAIMFNNRHVVRLEDDIVRPVIEDAVYQVVANEDGYFEAGEKCFKVTPAFVYSTLLADKALLQTVPLTDSVHHKNITSLRTATTAVSKCVYRVEDSYFENHGGCKDDDRVYLIIQSFRYCGSIFDPPPSYCSMYATIRVENFKRQWLTCKWVSHEATLSFENVTVRVGGSLIQATPLTRKYWYIEQSHDLGDIPNKIPYTDKPYPLESAYGEAKSSSVAGGKAIVNFWSDGSICF